MYGQESHATGRSSAHHGFEALGEVTEILGTLLPDRVDSRGGLSAQSPAATAGAVGDTATFGKLVEVLLLDVHLRANVRPTPAARQVQARENPCLKLLPGVFRQEVSTVPELFFDGVEPPAASPLVVPVDAEDKTSVIPSWRSTISAMRSDFVASVIPPSSGSWQTRTCALRLPMERSNRSNSGFRMY